METSSPTSPISAQNKPPRPHFLAKPIFSAATRQTPNNLVNCIYSTNETKVQLLITPPTAGGAGESAPHSLHTTVQSSNLLAKPSHKKISFLRLINYTIDQTKTSDDRVVLCCMGYSATGRWEGCLDEPLCSFVTLLSLAGAVKTPILMQLKAACSRLKGPSVSGEGREG